MKTTKNIGKTLFWGTLILLITFTFARQAAAQADAVVPATASAQAGGSTWITVSSPFSGDANQNSYTVYEYSLLQDGPWTQVCNAGTPGESAWRHCAFGNLTPNTDYFVRVTFNDPDGVTGPNPQLLGPIHSPALSINAVIVGTATVTVQDTYLLVAVPITEDANRNSLLQSVELATSESGPWTQKCGPPSLFAPKLCRIHGLTENATYWVRATLTDPDGVNGSNPRVIGPIHYTGRTNLALGKTITADPGWGCCPNPAQLVDGRIQYPNWRFGFAWTGGTSGWGGGSPGWKQATIDLGSPKTVSRVDWWTHNPGNVPTTWKVLVSQDGLTYTEVFATTEPRCRTETQPLDVNWAFPACGHRASFEPITTRYIRYSFDDATLFNGIHGWAVEIEVFGPTNLAIALTPPTAINPIGTEHTVTATIDLEGNPVVEQTVGFVVSGANSTNGRVTTDTNSQATFTYTGTDEGGDTITAWIELDGDNVQDQDEPFAVATKTWVNPVANLTITKTVTSSNILTHTFNFTGDLGDFSLPIGGSQTFSNLAVGSYTIQEDKTSFPDKSWALLSVICEGNSEPVEVDLANAEATLTLRAGENITCTFYNERATFEEGKYQRYLPIILKAPNHRDTD